MDIRDYRQEFTYPDRIGGYAHNVVNVLNQDNFFEDEEIDPRIFFENLCQKAMSNWVSGNTLELREDEMIEVITSSSAQTVLESLKSKGMLDSIEDEDGVERFFLTTQGKQIADYLVERDDKELDNDIKEVE